jgi:hypothetical protein
MAPATLSPDRAAWREAVAAIAAKAHAKLPECAGRIDSAVKLVLLGEVTLLPDGTAHVGSCTDPAKTYTVNGRCDCKDYERAPGQLCKHRLAFGIARRAQELTSATLADTTGQTEPPSQPTPAPLPEAPVSITLKASLHGQEIMVTLRGTDFASVKAQVEDASQWLQAQSGHTADDTPQCPKHGAMKPSTKGKGWYCPHKLADGSWCKGK